MGSADPTGIMDEKLESENKSKKSSFLNGGGRMGVK